MKNINLKYPYYRFMYPSMPDISLFKHYIDEIVSNGFLSNNGEKLCELEANLASLLNVQHVICVSSATLGLIVLIRALNLEQNTEFIIPSFNFPALAEAIYWNGLKLKFADIKFDNLTLNPADVKLRLSPKTRIIAPVHTFGNLADFDAFQELTEYKDIKILYDGASALGTLIKNPRMNCKEIGTVISFHAVKMLPAGEGGAILTNNHEIAENCRKLINFGFEENRYIQRYGINAKMSELNAAFALAGLKTLKTELDHRIDLTQAYLKNLSRIYWLIPHVDENAVLQLFAVTVSPQYHLSARRKLRKIWSSLGIETRCYYDPPLHKMSIFHSEKELKLPTTEDCSSHVICLPFHSRLNRESVCEIVERIESAGEPKND